MILNIKRPNVVRGERAYSSLMVLFLDQLEQDRFYSVIQVPYSPIASETLIRSGACIRKNWESVLKESARFSNRGDRPPKDYHYLQIFEGVNLAIKPLWVKDRPVTLKIRRKPKRRLKLVTL